MSIRFDQAINRLREHDLGYEQVALQSGYTLVVSRHGGRIFGPFRGEDGESILWMTAAFADAGAFTSLLNSGEWNIGGDRIWIAPELQYNVRDRNNFFPTYCLPAQVDPGTYTLEKLDDSACRLKQQMELLVYPEAARRKSLHMERVIRKVDDPLHGLRRYADLVDGVDFAGFEQEISLAESQADDVLSEAWNLTQVNTGGSIYVCATPGLEYSDFYEPVGDYQTIHPHYAKLKIRGDKRYKVGYKAACVTGRAAYHNALADGTEYLLIRNWFNDPSAPYTKEPASAPGCRGHSIHVYHDDGNMGGFAELECSNPPIGGPSLRSRDTGRIATWLYLGPRARLNAIAVKLLGIEL